MFLAASVVVLPQLLANHSGHGLELPDPFQGCPGQPPVSTWASFTATVSSLVRARARGRVGVRWTVGSLAGWAACRTLALALAPTPEQVSSLAGWAASPWP